jgi:hypothetical protein
VAIDFVTPLCPLAPVSYPHCDLGIDVGCLLRVIEIIIDTLDQNVIITKRYPPTYTDEVVCVRECVKGRGRL